MVTDKPKAKRKPPNAGKGRPKGSKNRATQDLRQAITMLIEDNREKLQGWLDQVAKRDPAKAFELVHSLFEFSLPKLSRIDNVGPGTEINIHTHIDFGG